MNTYNVTFRSNGIAGQPNADKTVKASSYRIEDNFIHFFDDASESDNVAASFSAHDVLSVIKQ